MNGNALVKGMDEQKAPGFLKRLVAVFKPQHSIASLPVELDVKKIVAMEAASGQEGPDGGKFSAAPACLHLQPIKKGLVISKGGIALMGDGYRGRKDNESRHAGANYLDYLRYGIVVGCGVYQQRDGTIVWDFPGWPLPNGTVVEHEVHHAMGTPSVLAGDIECIRCDTLRRWWYPGEWEPWMYEAAEELKAEGFAVPDFKTPANLERRRALPEVSRQLANGVH